MDSCTEIGFTSLNGPFQLYDCISCVGILYLFQHSLSKSLEQTEVQDHRSQLAYITLNLILSEFASLFLKAKLNHCLGNYSSLNSELYYKICSNIAKYIKYVSRFVRKSHIPLIWGCLFIWLK